MIKILFIGDIVGSIGRSCIANILPKLKKRLKIDIVIANGENLAHGRSVTEKILTEMIQAEIDFFTSGDHIYENKQAEEILKNKKYPIIRPANYPPLAPGDGWRIIEIGKNKLIVVNLIGRVFMAKNYDCPFRKFDEIYKNFPDIPILVDFHAEASSEKNALKYYLDNRVSAIIGTHTHTPTADLQISKNGTAYVSDAGMVGNKDSILGIKKEPAIREFLTQIKQPHEISKTGYCIFNSIYIEINKKTKKALRIKRIDKEAKIL